MMKRLVVTMIIIIIIVLRLSAKSNYIEDPIYLGVILIDQPNIEKMERICEEYGLQESPSIDGYKEFKHSDGTEFRIGSRKENSKYYPTVKVSTKKNIKQIDSILLDAGFIKDNTYYYKGSKFTQRRTKCTVKGGSRKIILFEKEYNALPSK